MHRAIVLGAILAVAWTAAANAAPTSVLTYHFDNVPGENYAPGGLVLDSSG